MVRVYSGKKLGQDLLSETGTPGMYSLPNKGVQISSKGTKNTHDSDVREACPDVPWSPSCFFDGAVDDKGWANAFILLQGMFNNIMGLKEEERKKGIRADTMQSLLYSWSKESKNNAIGKVWSNCVHHQ